MKSKKEKVEGVLEPVNVDTSKDELIKILIFALVGLLLIVVPETLNTIVGIIAGLFLLVIGCMAIFNYLQNKKGDRISFASGILYSVLGAIIMIYPYSIIRLVAICLGVYLALNGFLKIPLAMKIRDTNTKWLGTFVVGIVNIILGLLLVFNPFSGIAITKIAGVFLVVVAVMDILDKYLIRK